MKYLNFILATFMLLCLAPMPYGYYTLVRFVAMIAFGVFAYTYYQKEEKALAVTFGALAVLFQPLIKIALGRTMWNIVDVAVAILLIVCFFQQKSKQRNNN